MANFNELAFHKEVSLFPSAARAEAAYNSDEQLNDGYRGIDVYVDITAESGTATLDFKLQAKDAIGGDWADIAGASIAQQSAVVTAPLRLTIYPGIAETSNVSVSDILPRRWRGVLTVGGTTVTMTCSVSVVLLK